jgi:PHD/YefM family antitoxin component YafN of YafNO toxin-antitoxin module
MKKVSSAYNMITLTANKAIADLNQVIEQAGQSHAPIFITGNRANAVLIAEEDWNAIQETLYLTSIPGMRESILEGMKTPLEECDEELDW